MKVFISYTLGERYTQSIVMELGRFVKPRLKFNKRAEKTVFWVFVKVQKLQFTIYTMVLEKLFCATRWQMTKLLDIPMWKIIYLVIY